MGEQRFEDPSPQKHRHSLTGAIQAAVADLDNDGDQDITATAFNGSEMYWYDNNGSETFTRRVVTETASRPFGMAVGDLDGDMDVDLALCDFEGDAVPLVRERRQCRLLLPRGRPGARTGQPIPGERLLSTGPKTASLISSPMVRAAMA